MVSEEVANELFEQFVKCDLVAKQRCKSVVARLETPVKKRGVSTAFDAVVFR
jgi:hypothetical protein